MADEGKQVICCKCIVSPSGTFSFAKALNRSVTGSMNDNIHAGKFIREDDLAPSDIGYRLFVKRPFPDAAAILIVAAGQDKTFAVGRERQAIDVRRIGFQLHQQTGRA